MSPKIVEDALIFLVGGFSVVAFTILVGLMLML